MNPGRSLRARPQAVAKSARRRIETICEAHHDAMYYLPTPRSKSNPVAKLHVVSGRHVNRPRSCPKPLALTHDEREQLEQLVRDHQGRRALAKRARIVLSCHAGCSHRESAKRLKVTAQTVGKWRARFVAHGLPGLTDQPRSGAPRSISDALVEAVLVKTLHEKPPGAARWSSRRLAATLGVSQGTVLRIWRAFEL
jgi:transposase